MGWNKVAIVGAGIIRFGELFEKSYEAMMEEAFLAAVQSVDKGFNPKDIEAGWLGTCYGTLWGLEIPGGSTLASNIGLPDIGVTRVENGCPTGSDAFRNACMGVASGVFNVAVVVGVEKMREKPTEDSLIRTVIEQGHPVYGRGLIAPALFAPFATRHMHEFGTTREQMALVSVKNHRNGVHNPHAHFRFELSVEAVLNSPPVCEPFHLYDCCPQTDGAAALIICNADIADRYTDKPVYVAGFGLGHDYQQFHEKINMIELPATIRAGKRAYGMAGVGPQDIDVAELHDCFSFVEILHYEDLGFCEKGRGGRFVAEGKADYGGQVVTNPSGGLISKGHPLGATGPGQLYELFHQLRGDAGPGQVEIQKGYALQHNVGGPGSATSCVTILTNRKN